MIITKEYDIDKYIPDLYPEIPRGHYQLIIEECQDSKFGIGINIKWQIVMGLYAGRTFFETFYLQHDQSSVATKGRNAIKGIKIATGMINLQDTTKLKGLKLSADIHNYKSKEGKIKYGTSHYESHDSLSVMPQQKTEEEIKDEDLPF